ncbi:hypothetical protein AOLI_G00166070 [Acnodon oligacanthus]
MGQYVDAAVGGRSPAGIKRGCGGRRGGFAALRPARLTGLLLRSAPGSGKFVLCRSDSAAGLQSFRDLLSDALFSARFAAKTARMTKPVSLSAPLLALLLWRLGEVAEACSCAPAHPQQAYCTADVVIRAKVTGQKEVLTGSDTYGNPIKKIQYDIKQLKMFKGPSQEISAIFTAPTSAVCGVALESDGKSEYLVTGKLESDGTVHVTLCDFIVPWNSLTPAQRKGFDVRYETGCGCRIVRCSSVPCSVSDPVECLWTDWITESTVQGPQAQHYTCIKRNDNSCAWYRGAALPKNDFMDIEDP